MSQKDESRHAEGFGFDPSEEPPPYTATPYSHSRLSSTFVTAQTEIQEFLNRFNDGIPRLHALNRHSELEDKETHDIELFLCLISHVGNFLAGVSTSISSSNKSAQRLSRQRFEAELYLIPDDAVPLEVGWHLSEAADRVKQGALIQETRVRAPKQGVKSFEDTHNDSNRKPEKGERQKSRDSTLTNRIRFSESITDDERETRDLLWWRDEYQAQFLAQKLGEELGFLPGLKPSVAPSWAEVTTTAGVHRNGNMNYEVAGSCMPSSSGHGNSSNQSSGHGGNISTLADAGSVKARTRAEHMTFRRENDMGLWESRSGWTIVFSVMVNG